MTHTRFLAAALALAGVAACSNDSSTSPNAGNPLTISFAPTAQAGLSAAGALGASVTTDSVTVSKVQLVLSRISLEVADSSCVATAEDRDDERNESECRDLKLNPVLVTVTPGTTTAQASVSTTAPAGTYTSFHAKLRPVDARRDSASRAFVAANPGSDTASVHVEATYQGKNYVFNFPVKAEIVTRFNPPLTVTSTTNNLTVGINVGTWFRDRNGAAINPATLSTDRNAQRAVMDNIRRSFRAFEDRDRDGHDDHENEHHG